MNDSNTPGRLTDYEHSSDELATVSKSNFWKLWDSREDRRNRLIARDHLLTLAQETAIKLKEARSKLGLTITDIEGLTFVNAQIIESIEQGQWDRLPARVYARGATFSYANAVGLADPDTHANNISNVLHRPDHLSPSSGLMKKRTRNIRELRVEVISLTAFIILAVLTIEWFQTNFSIAELLNLETTNEETSNIIDLTYPIILSVVHPSALRYEHSYTQSYEYKRR